MDFLYFPDDKMEYIPSLISLAIFMLLAVGAMYWFIKKSKREEKSFNEKYNQGEFKIDEKDNSPNKNKSK